MPEAKKMISFFKACEIIERTLFGINLAVETIDVRKAIGRTVVEDCKSILDLPPFDKSAMDGYAVLANDEREEYKLLEVIPAGSIGKRKLEPGTTVKVMTGAAVPEGAGRVIMVEDTKEVDGKVHIISDSGSKRTNVCQKGEDIRSGDLILKAPAVLGVLEVANLISAGITEVKVTRPICVSILSTGDEIVDSVEHLKPGKIMNSNGPMLEALCRENNLKVVDSKIVPDDYETTVSTIKAALGKADIVLISGGVSVGDFDFVCDAMAETGLKVHFSSVAIKPGKPMTFATAEEKVALGLPGNPVSVYMMFHLFVLRAAYLITGRKFKLRSTSLPIEKSYKRRRSERVSFVPARLTCKGSIEPVEYHGSAHLSALLDSDGFFVVPEGITQLSAGDNVNFTILRGNPQ